MREKIKHCFSAACEDRFVYHQYQEDAKKAKLRNKQISKILKQQKKEELKKLKILLLGETLLHLITQTPIWIIPGFILRCD